MIPRADDESKEILVKHEEEPTPAPVVAAPKPVTPPTKPVRNGGDHVGGGSSLFVCASCDEPISGTMITAMGKRWHSDHFVCSVCDLNLEHVQFFHKDGQPYCHFDYHDKFSPKCGHCNTPIENECLTALGKSWHPGHFFCRDCGDPFEEDGYMVHDGFPYCEKDYLRLFAPKCTGCQDPIQGDFISALKGKWHRDCFGCSVCHIGFDATSYYVENGKPYCKAHYKNGSRATATPTA
ncbi:LIM-domain-containing protein [Linnemannia elongata AG-77]|uniref:LIM-domain-containing protein n=1 Tax=Linnemannia elongata AG-77 TaxID=1314771 RepID=A0A197KCW7_9FUNG|nr:LIM-domain-containing protein [Linnemannia elongata AG-77]